MMHTSESNVSRWLDGLVSPRPDRAKELARLLKVPLETVYGK